MTTDLVEKCASDLCVAIWGMDYRPRPGMMPDARWSTALHATLAVIDALADGVSDETLAPMARAIHDRTWEDDPFDGLPKDGAERGLAIEIARAGIRALSAAIRAAKSREG